MKDPSSLSANKPAQKQLVGRQAPLLLSIPVAFSKSIPPCVYRFFEDESHAQDFVDGSIWISTLSACRSHEGAERGDKEEGHDIYNTGCISGQASDPHVARAAAKLGIPKSSKIHVELVDNEIRTILPDAWVLCTTLRFAPDEMLNIGKHCVRISEPHTFMMALTRAIGAENPLVGAAALPITYASRTYTGAEAPPGPPLFVKPPDAYADQQEFRLAWQPPPGLSIRPFLVNCTGVRGLVKRQR